MPIWTNSSPDCGLSRILLPSSTQLRANRQVRRNLLTQVELMGLQPAAHHRLLIQALQETAEGKVDRFAARLSQINPSILIPPWYLGHAPGDRLARSRNILAPSLGLVEVRDLASRLLAEAAPQRGLECGYDR